MARGELWYQNDEDACRKFENYPQLETNPGVVGAILEPYINEEQKLRTHPANYNNITEPPRKQNGGPHHYYTDRSRATPSIIPQSTAMWERPPPQKSST